jgi:hypothetical protein
VVHGPLDSSLVPLIRSQKRIPELNRGPYTFKMGFLDYQKALDVAILLQSI